MKTTEAGLRFIAGHEGIVLSAYRDIAGVWTIGIGHTSSAGPPQVRPGMRISREEAFEILARDVATFEAAVTRQITQKLARHEFDALVSFAFNLGEGALQRSSLRRHLNAGDRRRAADAMLAWNKARVKGVLRPVKGLTKRRRAERALFLDADYGDAARRVSAHPPKPTGSRGATLLRRGSQGTAVRHLQSRLNALGLGPLATDAVFGPATAAAVKVFQRAQGLAVDGIVGSVTATRLKDVSLETASRETGAVPSREPLRRGLAGAILTVLALIAGAGILVMGGRP